MTNLTQRNLTYGASGPHLDGRQFFFACAMGDNHWRLLTDTPQFKYRAEVWRIVQTEQRLCASNRHASDYRLEIMPRNRLKIGVINLQWAGLALRVDNGGYVLGCTRF